MTPKQRYRLSDKGRTENRERMRRRRAAIRACGDGAAGRLRIEVDAAGLGRCAECGQLYWDIGLDVDHIERIVDGGCDTDENVQLLCRAHHNAKTAREAAVQLDGGTLKPEPEEAPDA